MKPVYDESGALVDYVTSESIPKGTAVSRVVGRKMKIYRLKGDPDIYSNQILDVHSEYGEMPYGWQMNFWTAIAFLAKYYFGKVIPVFKTKGINCISWVDFGSAQLGYNIIPEDEWVLESELEKSDKLEYVGDLEA
ncbi:MAG: hypothetical protein PHC43_00095 [Candidatus Marinimicrobia bacterium]|jgi:hypothetical protein|nr:hypothetical protein [Candidatus Neomarinimicrobiota bacterium]